VEKTNRRLGFKLEQIKTKLIGGIMLLMSFFLCKNTFSLNIIYDEEAELYLQNLARPIFRAANQPFNRNNFFIVNDDGLNAFVADGNALFINTGTIISSDNDDEIAGVIAHEVGHIQGGHILRGKLRQQELSEVGLASMLLAGAAAVMSGRGDVGMAIMLGSQSSILNSYLSYMVEEERSADEAGIKFLKETQTSPEGMRNFMKKIAQQNIAEGIEETSYFRTHPVTKERLGFLDNAVKNSHYTGRNKTSEEFLRVKAKLIAFLYTPDTALKYYPKNNTIPEKYAHTIIYFKQMKKQEAINNINELIGLEPNNPFFRELKAQIFMETGDVKTAKKEYKKALDLLPNSTLLKVSYAQATIEDEPTSQELKELETMLNQAVFVRPSYEAWILLARTYGMQNKLPEANYASAEGSFRLGLFDVAKKQANDALKGNSSPKLTLKINDLINRIDEYKR
jgi:predicted Zn-dependent protease